MFNTMTNVCSTTAYRTITHFAARFDSNVILVKCPECKETVHLMPVCVLSDFTTGYPESASKYAYSKT